MKLSKIYSENRLLILLVSILVILIGLPVIILVMLNRTAGVVAWYDTDWGYRKTVDVSNNTGSTLTNEDVLITLDTATLISNSKLQSNCQDLRFLDSDDSTLLDYWIEGGCGTTTTEIWVQIPSLPSAGKTIFVYYGNDAATSGSLSWSGNYITMFNSSCPTGWSRVTALDDTFLMGSSSYGSTGGSLTHNHTYSEIPSHTHGSGTLATSTAGAHRHSIKYSGSTASGNKVAALSASRQWDDRGVAYAGDHTHTITGSSGTTGSASGTTSSESSLPPYRTMILCSPDDSNLSVVPQDSIFLFESLPASGYTRYASLDDKFPMASSTSGSTGGTSTHTHTYTTVISHSHGVGSLVTETAGSHTHNLLFRDGVTGTYPYISGRDRVGSTFNDILSYAGSHTHTITGSVASTGVATPETESVSNLPPYVDMIYATQDSEENSFLPDSILLTSANPPLGWNRYSDLDDKFARGSASYGSTGGASTHDHGYSEVPSHTHTVGSYATASAGNHTHTVTGYDYITGYQPYPIIGAGTYDWRLPDVIEEAGNHTHIISGSTASAGVVSPSTSTDSGLPPYTSVIYSQRKDSQVTLLGDEDRPVPNAPTIQSANAVSTTQIDWNFTDNSSDELGFKVYDETDTLKVTCDTPNISSCSETGLTENTQYTRKVVAYSSFGNSIYSDTVSAYTRAGDIDITDIESTVDTVTMTSSTFANPTVASSGYYFDCTSGSCDTGINEWIQTNTDQATGLDNNTGYEFTVKNRNGDGVENSYSATAIEIWTKAAVPTVASTDITDTTVSLEGTGVNYLAQGSSGLYFDCITGASCDTGINEWVSASTDTVVGLLPDTQYEFKVKARNYDGVETSYSSNTVSIYTDSTEPTISSVNNPTVNSLDVTIDNQSNPSTTVYLVEEVNTAKYLDSNGDLVIEPVWLTYSQLGSDTGLTVGSLDSNIEYSFRVKAKNQSDVETAFSDPVSAYTKLVAPTALTPDTKTQNSITWKLSTTETGYDGIKVYDSSDNLKETCVGSDITECEETGLNPNTEYTRKLTIYSTQSESAFSSSISESTNAQPISISLASPLPDYYEVSLTIDLGDNPVGTDIQIFEETTSKYIEIGLGGVGYLVLDESTIESDGNSIVVGALLPNTQYTFKVRALDQDSNPTSWSSTVNVRTYAKDPFISLTQSLTTTSGRIKVDLNDNPAGTRVSVMESGGLYLTEEGLLSETEDIFVPSIDGIEITNLDPNTEYSFKTRAFNEDNIETEWSDLRSFTTRIEQPDIEVSDQTEDSITLTFSGLSNIETGDSGIYVEDIGEWSKDLSQTVSGLDPNTEYTFNVKARNSTGIETGYIVSPAGYTLAQIPEITQATPTSTNSGTLTVDLKDNPDNTRISIQESTSGKYLNSEGSLLDTETILQTDDLAFAVTGLSSNTVYSFKIKAYNEEDESTEYSTTTKNLTTLIQSPTLSTTNITSSSVSITVSGLNNMTTEDSGILIERLGNWTKSLTQTIENLNANTSYTFRVKARNRNGVETSYVSTSEVQTLADVPEISSVRKLSSNTARVYIDTNGNPSYTQFAIRDSVSGQYLNANGTLQNSAVWQTYSQWGGGLGKYVTGLDGLRQVGFQIKARNTENEETSFSDPEYIGTGSILINIPQTVSVKLKDDENVDLTSDAQLGVQDVRLKKDNYILADLKVSFEQDRDWKDIVVDADTNNSKTVVKVSEEQGISEPFTMYVVKNETNAFRLCPQAQSLEEVQSGCTGEQMLTKDFPQEVEIEGNTVTISLAKIDGTYYWIADGLTGTGGMGETVEGEQQPVDEEEQTQEPQTTESNPIVSNIVKRVSNVANEVSKSIVLGTTEILDKTAIGELNQEQLSTAVATTTTVTITVGIASTGITQSFYLIFHLINGLFNAFGFRRKKKPFGYVYDSNSKDPISNAVVRIYKGDELVETSVTNVDGIFLSNLKKGSYKIEVKKGGYTFPSKLVKGNEDYPLKNVYKGGDIVKAESSDLIINIPLDKKELSEGKKFSTVLRSIVSVVLTILNIALFILGILLIIYTYYKHPESFNWYVLILYIPALYFLTKSIFNKKAVYGKVLDSQGNPVADKEIFLVSKEFDEVVAKRVTDKEGRYRFICEKGEYELRMGNRILLSDIKVKRNGYVLAKKVSLN